MGDFLETLGEVGCGDISRHAGCFAAFVQIKVAAIGLLVLAWLLVSCLG